MFYEEKIIDGVLHYRSAPDDEWSVVSPENMTLTIERLRDELSSQSSRERKLVEAARSVFAEKGSLLDALNKLSDAVQMYRGMYE